MNGLDVSSNIIEICPNHHAEATEDEEKFAKKFNLIGTKKTEEELNDLKEFSQLFFKNNKEPIDINKFIFLIKKYNFDDIDAISYFMGISRNSFINQYSYIINKRDEQALEKKNTTNLLKSYEEKF